MSRSPLQYSQVAVGVVVALMAKSARRYERRAKRGVVLGRMYSVRR